MSPLLEKELVKFSAETRRRQAGLMAAQGLIAQAETLSDHINQNIGEHWLKPTLTCVTLHDDGSAYVRVLVLHHPDRVRQAIAQLGLVVSHESISENEPGLLAIHLYGIDVPLVIIDRPIQKEAA